MQTAGRACGLCLQQAQQLLGFLDLLSNAFLRKELLRPARMERKAGKKRCLAFQYVKRLHFPLPRQTNHDLLDPGWAQRLREIRVADYLREKIERVTGNFVGVVGGLDQRFDLGQKGPIRGHCMQSQPGDRDRNVDLIGIVLARMRMAGVIEVVE
jgi:hypothetical protein